MVGMQRGGQGTSNGYTKRFLSLLIVLESRLYFVLEVLTERVDLLEAADPSRA